MSLLTLPAFAWGSAADINAWTDIATPVMTTGVTDPFGGTSAVTINDNNAAASEGKSVSAGALTGATVVFGVCAKAGTATASAIQVRDTTASAFRIQANIAWSGGVPTLTAPTGTAIGTISLGNSWYFILCTGTWVTGNVGQLELYGASSTAATMGTTSYYLRHLVFTDYIPDAVGDDESRAGSEQVQGPSGLEDAWTTGTDYTLSGTIRWIPAAPTADPVVKHGWVGQAEYQGINDSVSAMLRAARDKSAITFVPDRADCTTVVSTYLVNVTERATAEADRQDEKSRPIVLRATVPIGTV